MACLVSSAPARGAAATPRPRANIRARRARRSPRRRRRARRATAFGNRRRELVGACAPDRSRSRPGARASCARSIAGSLIRRPIQRFSTGRPRSARHALLMQLVVEERFVVGDDDRAPARDSGRRSRARSDPSDSRRRRARRPEADRSPARATRAPRRRPCPAPSRCRRRRRSRCSPADARSGNTHLASPAATGCRKVVRRKRVRRRPARDRRAHAARRRVRCAASDFDARRRSAVLTNHERRRRRRARPEALRAAPRRANPARPGSTRRSAAAPGSPCSSRCGRMSRASTGSRARAAARRAQACSSEPPRSIQSRLRITSASRTSWRRAPGHVQTGRKRMQRVLRRKARSGLDIGEDEGVEALGERDAPREVLLVVRHSPDHQQRALRRRAAARDFAHGFGWRDARSSRSRYRSSAGIGTGAGSALFLQRRVERHVDRPAAAASSRCGTRAGSLRVPPPPNPAGRPTSCSRARAHPGRARCGSSRPRAGA